MKKMSLSNDYLSAFCLQISLLLHAGISIGDGLHMLSEDEEDAQVKELLCAMSEQVDDGYQISEAMERMLSGLCGLHDQNRRRYRTDRVGI